MTAPLSPVPPPADPAESPAAAVVLPRADQRLFKAGITCVGVFGVYFAYQWRADDIVHLYQGLAIFVLATLPALSWAKRGDGGFPLMEVFMLTTVNTYAVPLLIGHEGLAQYSDEVITTAANAVILYQLAAVATFALVRGHPKRTPFWVEEIISENLSRFLTYGLVAATLYMVASTFFYEAVFSYLPAETEGILRAAFFGLGIICTFILCRRWGLGQLSPGARAFVIANLTAQFFVQSTSLLLIAAISTVVLALLGYVSGRRKVPVVPVLGIVAVIAVLHNGKSAMREKYWAPGVPEVTLSGLPGYFAEWFRLGLQPDDSTEHNAAAKLFDRTSLFQIITLVVERTPSKQPFLRGETYADIPGQFVPRFFWPNKPTSQVSTSRLSVYYGLQTEEEAQTTSIGVGMVSEAYANFGFFGVGVLGCLFGFVFKKVTAWTRHSPMLSYGGLVLVLLMAWSFQSELTLSVWLSSLFQASVAVLGIPFVLRNLFA